MLPGEIGTRREILTVKLLRLLHAATSFFPELALVQQPTSALTWPFVVKMHGAGPKKNSKFLYAAAHGIMQNNKIRVVFVFAIRLRRFCRSRCLSFYIEPR